MARTTSVFHPISPGTQQKLRDAVARSRAPARIRRTPSDPLLTDRPMLVCLGLWVRAVELIIYRPI
jgi:hypothetical protein